MLSLGLAFTRLVGCNADHVAPQPGAAKEVTVPAGILSPLSNIEQIFRRNACNIIWLNDVNLQNRKLPRMEFDPSPFGLYLGVIAGDLAARPEDCACSRSLSSNTI
jgi:hypothetical protein